MIITRKMAVEACETLGWGEENLEWMTEAGINAQYRTAAKQAHPDAGGDAAKFAAVDRSKHVLLGWLARRGPEPETKPHGGVSECPRCFGSRTIFVQGGFRRLRMQCPTCNGAGEIYEREKEGDKMS